MGELVVECAILTTMHFNLKGIFLPQNDHLFMNYSRYVTVNTLKM